MTTGRPWIRGRDDVSRTRPPSAGGGAPAPSPTAPSNPMISGVCLKRRGGRRRATTNSHGAFCSDDRRSRRPSTEILACLNDTNRVWAERAPVLMISVATLTFGETGKPNRHAFHDVGLAVEDLVFQAAALGLVVHQMGGMSPHKVTAAFNLPPHHEAVTGIAVGCHGDPTSLPQHLYQRELTKRTRKSLSAFVFSESWDRPSSIV